jgi:hypothetical protein
MSVFAGDPSLTQYEWDMDAAQERIVKLETAMLHNTQRINTCTPGPPCRLDPPCACKVTTDAWIKESTI